MDNFVPEILPILKSNRLPGLDLGNEVNFPFYDGYSIANLPNTISQLLGAPDFGSQPLGDPVRNALGGPPYQHVILLVIDGLGLYQFDQILNPVGEPLAATPIWQRLMQNAALFPLTSVVPSTTSTALTTLWTGAYPSAHGIVGYEVWLKEYGVIANMIFHSAASYVNDTGGLQRAGFQPETFLALPRFGSHLSQNGVWVGASQPQAIAYSGLSMMLMNQPQVNIFPFRTQSDLWVTLSATLSSRSQDRSYHYIYWGDLDELSHRYNPQDERVMLEIASFGLMLERFLAKMKRQNHGDTLLLITADHGHISTPRQPAFDLKNHPDLLDCLTMVPTGEGRLAFLFLRPGREQKMLNYIEKTWPGKFCMIRSEQVIQSGLLGNGSQHPRLTDRLGDWVAIPAEGVYWWWANKDNHLLGRHGGLTPTEMLVPLIAIRL